MCPSVVTKETSWGGQEKYFSTSGTVERVAKWNKTLQVAAPIAEGWKDKDNVAAPGIVLCTV